MSPARCFALALLLGGLGLGCPEVEEAPSATCARVGDKCKLPSGPLGVCMERACPEGEAAPCLYCQGQH